MEKLEAQSSLTDGEERLKGWINDVIANLKDKKIGRDLSRKWIIENDPIGKMLATENLDVVRKDGDLIQSQYFLELLQFIITTVKE